jgi:hypothetical protein
MPQGLDHIVHAVRNLDAAAAIYQRAGFIVGVRNAHPWGTHNRIVQFGNAYIELLEVAEPDKIPPHVARRFAFGAFNRDFLMRQEGLSMLVLKSRDADADQSTFNLSGIGGYDSFHFSRQGVGPDGAPVNLAFSLAFATDPRSPEVGFAVCQNHNVESFWNPAFQSHANGATRITAAVGVADNPSDHLIFLGAFTGASDLRSSSLGIKAAAENEEIEIVDEKAFRDQFGVAPRVKGEGMTLNAMRFAVPNLSIVEAYLKTGGIEARRHVGRLVVPPDSAVGATLIFEATNKA